MKFLTLLLTIVLAFPTLAFAGKGDSIQIDWKLAGTVVKTGDVQVYDVALKGTPGKARALGAGSGAVPVTIDGLPEGHVCDDNPYAPPGTKTAGVLPTHAQVTITFNDLSMLFLDIAEGSYVCIWTPFVYGVYEIVGGAGKYEGATGMVVFEFDLYRDPFPSGSNVTAETGVAWGEIVLP